MGDGVKVCIDWCRCDRTLTHFLCLVSTITSARLRQVFFFLALYLHFFYLPQQSGCLCYSSSPKHTHTRTHRHCICPLPSLQTVVNKSQEEKTLSPQKKGKCYMTAVPLGGGEGGRKRLDESRGEDTGKESGVGGWAMRLRERGRE